MDEEEREILAHIGLAVLAAQTVETLLRLCMTVVFQKNSPLTLEGLEQQERGERKRTIGYFINELRKRADLDDNLASMLEAFLEHRNTLVHSFNEIPGGNLDTPAGRRIVEEFLDNFSNECDVMIKVFSGAVLAWQEQIGWTGTRRPDGQLFDEIEARYKPIVHHLFTKKGHAQKSV